jgi:hypothetical protein
MVVDSLLIFDRQNLLNLKTESSFTITQETNCLMTTAPNSSIGKHSASRQHLAQIILALLGS